MSRTAPRIAGRTALVTGGAKRLGRAIALALAAEGANVIVHFRRSAEEAEETAREIRGFGVNAWTVGADLGRADEADAVIPRCAEACGGAVELLVNNASVFLESRLRDFSANDLVEAVQINAMSPLQITRAFARQTGRGAVVNLLDCRVTDYDANHAAYHLSKRMLLSMTRMAALEFAPGIRVNAVAPGLILPPKGEGEEYLQRLAGANPLNSVGNPEQIAEAALYLLGAEYVTGQTIFVDGGRHMKGCVYG